MSRSKQKFRCMVLSVLKHAYIANGIAAHPRFELVVVADDPEIPDWAHQRNQLYADQNGIPYIRNIEKAIAEHDVQVAIVSSEAERHCDLSVRAATAGLHVVQDKPMSTKLSECDRVVEAVSQNGITFMMWNRNLIPALVHAQQMIESKAIGAIQAVHVDFYFAKDAGPPIGERSPDAPPINWLERQIEAHADGSDGGLGKAAMGELQVEGIYPLAYIQMLTGAKVERVFARATSHFHQAHLDNKVDDLATVTLEMENGIQGSLCLGRIGAASHPDIGEIKLHIIGSKGAMVISEARPEVAVHYRGQSATEYPHQRIGSDLDYLLMENFAKAIDENGETILNEKVGRAISATVEAALESSHSGRVVEVKHLPQTT